MASPELQTLITALRSAPPADDDDLIRMRTNLEELVASVPLPDDVLCEPVRAGDVAAEWVTAPGSAADRAIVYFHGGGYAIGSVNTHRMLVGEIARATGARLLSVDYRLAPEHPFPAAVQDAVAAYRFVLGCGLDPEHVAVAGDSAGGGLAAASLLALRDAGDRLPAAAVLLSPWLDLTLTSDSMRSKADQDPLVRREGLQRMAEAYLAGTDAKTPTASPVYGDLRGLPPLLIHVGTAEVLLDDASLFAARARKAGVEVELEIWDEMIHVWHAFGSVLPEATQAIERIGAYVRAKLG
jgi:acetyl esterase/lipase